MYYVAVINIIRTEQNDRYLADDIVGLMQENRNSSVLAMGLRLSCTNPSIR